jgi:hypothetical protein
MSNIFNIQQIYSQIIQRTPAFGQTNSFYFYMSLQQDPTKIHATTFNRTTIGSTDLLQTNSSLLYNNIGENLNFNIDNSVGKSSTNSTVYNVNVLNSDSLYDSFVQTVFRLPAGTIGIAHTPKLQHFDDYYENQRNQIEWAHITFGTGMYMNKKGYIAMLSSTAPVKLIMVFLANDTQFPVFPQPFAFSTGPV